jgi:hypothetical protein
MFLMFGLEPGFPREKRGFAPAAPRIPQPQTLRGHDSQNPALIVQ